MQKNININCVSPGFINSKMTEKIPENIKKDLLSKIPLNRMGSGEDVSNAVAYLASDSASYITGETIHVMVVCIWLDKSWIINLLTKYIKNYVK